MKAPILVFDDSPPAKEDMPCGMKLNLLALDSANAAEQIDAKGCMGRLPVVPSLGAFVSTIACG